MILPFARSVLACNWGSTFQNSLDESLDKPEDYSSSGSSSSSSSSSESSNEPSSFFSCFGFLSATLTVFYERNLFTFSFYSSNIFVVKPRCMAYTLPKLAFSSSSVFFLSAYWSLSSYALAIFFSNFTISSFSFSTLSYLSVFDVTDELLFLEASLTGVNLSCVSFSVYFETDIMGLAPYIVKSRSLGLALIMRSAGLMSSLSPGSYDTAFDRWISLGFLMCVEKDASDTVTSLSILVYVNKIIYYYLNCHV